MTLKGQFGQWRASLLAPLAIDLAALGWKDQSLASALARATGLAPRPALAAGAALMGGMLLAFVFKDQRFRANARQVIGGCIVGATVVAGWYLTGHLGYAENPDTLETMSFVGPTAYALELLMLWTDKSLHATFGIAIVAGVVLGSLASALATRRFRWEGFASLDDLRNQLAGAVLMGFGGVTALGCTIGQGLSGVSTLALGSLLATASIIAGAVATMRLVNWRVERAG